MIGIRDMHLEMDMFERSWLVSEAEKESNKKLQGSFCSAKAITSSWKSYRTDFLHYNHITTYTEIVVEHVWFMLTDCGSTVKRRGTECREETNGAGEPDDVGTNRKDPEDDARDTWRSPSPPPSIDSGQSGTSSSNGNLWGWCLGLFHLSLMKRYAINYMFSLFSYGSCKNFAALDLKWDSSLEDNWNICKLLFCQSSLKLKQFPSHWFLHLLCTFLLFLNKYLNV